ncbi:hypothetical protein GWO43_18415 [candidate division KSB1 bacterium]|nr:hypothetical protein [candidate division KSB1 bacterium]NIR69581.1 hypothetical protein [candidate division KSB1 bacterium]NIS25929.1 hypothetical protein [candidate division KSB1 bacterium]NIT72810.1 hypothetical protein [candidate division KSB1 bacterium]NIU26617.1 hypothetical protein [candidate division KSB1 bacterium]
MKQQIAGIVIQSNLKETPRINLSSLEKLAIDDHKQRRKRWMGDEA